MMMDEMPAEVMVICRSCAQARAPSAKPVDRRRRDQGALAGKLVEHQKQNDPKWSPPVMLLLDAPLGGLQRLSLLVQIVHLQRGIWRIAPKRRL